MEPPAHLLQLIYAVATVVSAGLFLWVWNYRERAGAKPLLVALFGAVIWCIAPLAATLSDSYTYSVFAQGMLFIGVGCGVFGLFLFMLAYTGRERWIRPRVLGLLAVEPVLLVLFAFTNPSDLFFASIQPDQSALGIAVEFGPAFWIHAAYSFSLMFVGSVFILDFLIRSKAIYRGQAVALLLGIGFAWTGSLAHLVGPLSFNSTPIGITLAILLFAFAMVRYRLIDIVPIARDRVFDTISDIVLVVDRNDRVVDANQAARTLDGSEKAVTGQKLTDFFSGTPEVIEYYRANTRDQTEKTFEITVAEREYRGRLSPISDGRDRHVGWLIVGHDITEQKRRERELRHRNEQLDQFAGIVSHDLRNPLNVASARLELAREECESDHLDQIADAHERIETIVEETLTLARLGDRIDEMEPVDLGVALEQWWAGVDTSTASLDAPDQLVVRADPDRLRHVFENLFRNAVEHSSSGGPTASDGQTEQGVTVTVGQLEGGGIYIEDTGPGLPDDVSVFEAGETTSDGGTGLGLSIVEEIVTAHGWKIEATTSDSGGARFEITGVEIL